MNFVGGEYWFIGAGAREMGFLLTNIR